MEEFLKKYSTVPNGFIEDFFSIAREQYKNNELIIDLDIVVKWLNVRKNNLKRLLVENFEKDFDYSIIRERTSTINKRDYDVTIMITPDCFKELCMLSQTKKAKEVRKYYLSIEKLVNKYYQDIQNKLNKQIGLLENNQKPKINIKGGVIYFFRALNQIKLTDLDPDLFKIGKSINIKNRLNTYNSGNANDSLLTRRKRRVNKWFLFRTMFEKEILNQY